MRVHAYAARTDRGPLEPFEYDAGPLGPEEVDVRVTHAGVCHTDVALVDDDWGATAYPFVPGRENVGVVEAVGANVNGGLTVGERVGVGGVCGSCMGCEFCLAGRQHVCPQVSYTTMGDHRGGFGSHVRARHWRWAFPIPEAIESMHAGPLLGAGVTVFTPLVRPGVRATDRVAVVGVGGLGHLALQFLAKWGCEVTAISSSRDKESQARGFGARHFLATRDTDELKRAAGSFDFILNTVTADLPWDDYLAALRPGGTLCVVGIGDKPVAVGPLGLTAGEKRVAGGRPGAIVETRQMLAFAARHGTRPQVETFPLAEANAALEHVRRGRARFRAVLVA